MGPRTSVPVRRSVRIEPAQEKGLVCHTAQSLVMTHSPNVFIAVPSATFDLVHVHPSEHFVLHYRLALQSHTVPCSLYI